MFDIRFQYALHTTSYAEQPLNDRTLGRFRERCATYEKETGIDLLQTTITSLSNEMAEMMKLDFSLKRMDSLMIASNIKRMSRMELLYTCVANLAREVLKKEEKLPENLIHYTEKDDRNRVIYHNKSDETADKVKTILADAKTLKELCGTDYDVTKCPGGYAPKSCSFSNGRCIASFHRSQCESCPHFKECHPKVNKRTCRKTVSLKSKERASQQRYRSSEEFKKISSFRNGVETIPSILRRKYHIDTMPVRGKLRMKFFFGCKIGALSFKKFCKYMQSLDNCAKMRQLHEKSR